MARYYEEETLFQSAKDEMLKYFSDSFVYTSAELFHKVLANTPTADVVPKSEVERVYDNLKAVLEERAETKQEVAREIFEDIENNYADFLFDGYRNIVVITEKDFEELKNKYTENENG